MIFKLKQMLLFSYLTRNNWVTVKSAKNADDDAVMIWKVNARAPHTIYHKTNQKKKLNTYITKKL